MLARAHNDELDRGATKIAPGEERFCALTRTIKPVTEMIRFVIGPDGDIVPDVKRKLPGRGLWITATRASIEAAVKRNIFARGFKRDLRVDPDLPATADRLLERAALDALAMAGKSGRVAAGFGKVSDAIPNRNLAAVIHAADGSDDGKRKIAAALHRHSAERAKPVPVIGWFTSGQLDLALSGLNVVHAALLDGSASETFLARAERVERFRAGDSSAAGQWMAPETAAEDKERNE
jgi:hypothetical protein